jgi:hypothetical protein
MKLTKTQIEAVKRGEPVRVESAEVGGEIVLLNARVYAELAARARDEQAQHEWAAAVLRSLDTWVSENPD